MEWVRPRKDELRQVLKRDKETLGEVYLSFGWWCAEVTGLPGHTRHHTIQAAMAVVEERVNGK